MSSACRKKKQRRVKVLYEDNSLLVLNKPAGLVTLRVATFKGKTLQDFLEEEFNIFVRERGGIVHRLDKETQGIILVAKNNRAFDHLQDQFKERKVEKVYLALIRGKLTGEGEITAPIGRNLGRRLQFAVVPGGKKAETGYQVLKNLKINEEEYTLVKVRPKTGRTHQIRVHFKYLGNPVFGDSFYGGKKEQGRPMFLVAKEIKFIHPADGRLMEFKITIPKRLSSLMPANEKEREKG